MFGYIIYGLIFRKNGVLVALPFAVFFVFVFVLFFVLLFVTPKILRIICNPYGFLCFGARGYMPAIPVYTRTRDAPCVW